MKQPLDAVADFRYSAICSSSFRRGTDRGDLMGVRFLVDVKLCKGAFFYEKPN